MTDDERAALKELEFELTKPHTIREIAKRLGMPRQTVHDIEQRALEKLRVLLESEGKGRTDL